MPGDFPFERESIFPSWFANRFQDFLSAARTDLRLSLKSSTTVQVVPDGELGIAAIALEGRWRFITGSISRDHPGGAAGTYTVWAVGEDNAIDDSPKPHSDHTNYAFDLRITSGANPAGAGVVVFEKIGTVDWSGTEVTALRQTYGSVEGAQILDGSLSSSGPSITWIREPGGALVPSLKANSVTSTELAELSVDTAAIIDLIVTTAKIAGEAVTEGKLAANSVTVAKISALAVSTAKIAELAVTEGKLAALSVSTAKVQNLAITAEKLSTAVQEGLVKPGVVVATGAETADVGWLLCDGSARSRTTFAALFARISTRYGAGDGSTTFNLPNLKGRVPMGAGKPPNAGEGTTERVVGAIGGEQNHTLSVLEMPNHSHTISYAAEPGHIQGGAESQYIFNAGSPQFSTSAVGGNAAHNNLQPFQAFNYQIKT